MNAVVFALVVLVASVSALPQTQNAGVVPKSERLVADIVVTLIEELERVIRDRGLDPYYLEEVKGLYVLPIEGVFSASGYAQSVATNGLSNIKINDVFFHVPTGSLNVDITFPRVTGSVGRVAGDVDVLEYSINGEGSGSLALNAVRLMGSATVGFRNGQVTVDGVHIYLSVGSIESNISINILGNDYSDELNEFFSTILPAALETYSKEISVALNYLANYLIERFL